MILGRTAVLLIMEYSLTYYESAQILEKMFGRPVPRICGTSVRKFAAFSAHLRKCSCRFKAAASADLP